MEGWRGNLMEKQKERERGELSKLEKPSKGPNLGFQKAI